MSRRLLRHLPKWKRPERWNLVGYGDGTFLDFFDEFSDGFFDTAFEDHRVSAGCDVAHAFLNHDLGQDSSCRRAVTSDVVGLGCDFFDELSAHVFKGVFQFDIAGNGDTIVGDGRSAKFLVENDVAAFRPKVTFTAFAKASTPLPRARRASSLNKICLAMLNTLLCES